MPHSALECAASLPAVRIREKFEVSNRRHVEDRGDGLFLLPLVRNACLHGLKGRDIRLSQFEVVGGLPVYDADG